MFNPTHHCHSLRKVVDIGARNFVSKNINSLMTKNTQLMMNREVGGIKKSSWSLGLHFFLLIRPNQESLKKTSHHVWIWSGLPPLPEIILRPFWRYWAFVLLFVCLLKNKFHFKVKTIRFDMIKISTKLCLLLEYETKIYLWNMSDL